MVRASLLNLVSHTLIPPPLLSWCRCRAVHRRTCSTTKPDCGGWISAPRCIGDPAARCTARGHHGSALGRRARLVVLEAAQQLGGRRGGRRRCVGCAGRRKRPAYLLTRVDEVLWRELAPSWIAVPSRHSWGCLLQASITTATPSIPMYCSASMAPPLWCSTAASRTCRRCARSDSYAAIVSMRRQ